jgi:hypothetical protein
MTDGPAKKIIRSAGLERYSSSRRTLIKIFSGSAVTGLDALEAEVNEWFAANNGVDMISLTHSMSPVGDSSEFWRAMSIVAHYREAV